MFPYTSPMCLKEIDCSIVSLECSGFQLEDILGGRYMPSRLTLGKGQSMAIEKECILSLNSFFLHLNSIWGRSFFIKSFCFRSYAIRANALYADICFNAFYWYLLARNLWVDVEDECIDKVELYSYRLHLNHCLYVQEDYLMNPFSMLFGLNTLISEASSSDYSVSE